MTSSTLEKRPAPAMDTASPPCKKSRTDFSPSLPIVPKDELTVDISPFPLDFSLSDLPYDFAHPMVNSTDLRPTTFDNWLEDPPLDVLPVTDAFSDISSDESKPNPFVPLPPLPLPQPVDSHQDTLSLPVTTTTTTSTTTGPSFHNKIPSSPVSSECALRTEHTSNKATTATTTTASNTNRNTTSNSKPSQADIESHKKRQADRAARNRESSRRAREKQKNRFIQLQNGNVLLQQTLQRYKLQVEHLKSSLDRMHAMLSSCSMCSYNVAVVQQQQQQQTQQTRGTTPPRPAPNPSLLRQ
ncbi:hypothetical protein BWQ96_02947 [Gracilariopsis chorda]|uniref:BZIP domain-containing protein n=1 Tax=Gracilariopsis chorda TaxID=448386 RepID=A0A2V3IYW6_9FLOR|nr:hypothetical protein BWQ96_02947 [Gracilariopsis chorda]|eukprot:PXF47334.1 hypothetical protein BWQ96_02947 [Gracilariopsis chorda]